MPLDFLTGGGIILLLLAIFIIVSIFLGVRIVPQSQKYVVERFGRLRSVLGPGINLIVPFIDKVAHRVSILERQLPNQRQDAITTDNVLVQVDTSWPCVTNARNCWAMTASPITSWKPKWPRRPKQCGTC